MAQYNRYFDIGTYTGNGGQYRVGIPTLRDVGPGGKQVANSLRFRSANSNYLTRTFGTPATQLYFTFSFWVKRGTLGTNQEIFTAGTGSTNQASIYFDTSDKLNVYTIDNNITRTQLITTTSYKDTSQWYHITLIYNEGNGTSTERIRLYVNGSRVTSFSTATYPPGNAGSFWNASGGAHTIGRSGYTSGNYFDGTIANFYFIDNQGLDSSSFGEYNSDNIWVPKTYDISSVLGNSFYLQFAPGAVGTDSSSRGNNWTLNGFNVTTANTTYDIVTDSPTDYLSGSMSTANNAGNYATMSPLDYASSATFTNGNLTIQLGNASSSAKSNFKITSGKWYWEATSAIGDLSLASGLLLGVARYDLTAPGGYAGTGLYAYYDYDGSKYISGTNSAYGASFATNGTVIGFALDMDAGTLTCYKNNVSQGVLTSALSGLAVTPCIASGAGSGTKAHFNFGQRPFAYTPPAGYNAINTYNYPRPADSALWFYGDTPDLMWIKNRSTSSSHCIQDTVRGSDLTLFGSSTDSDTGYPYIMEMNKFGMSLQAGAGVNGSGNSHVYWAWKAGGRPVTNTDGTLTCQVSANRLAGFSIVTWTGTGTSNPTIGHGLGNDTPDLLLIKKRNKNENWYVAAYAMDNSYNYAYHMFLNTTGTKNGSNDPYYLNAMGSTSNVLSLGDGSSGYNGGNESGIQYVAYCFNPVPGFSAFGNYTGNGSSDGTFVYTGFRPRWILMKNITTGSHWVIYDTTRDTYNPVSADLASNNTNAENGTVGSESFDILSNGFKFRSAISYEINVSTNVYIYAAFAENPFKFARAR